MWVHIILQAHPWFRLTVTHMDNVLIWQLILLKNGLTTTYTWQKISSKRHDFAFQILSSSGLLLLFKRTICSSKMGYTCFCFLKKDGSSLPFNLRKLFEFFLPDNSSWHFRIIKVNYLAHKAIEDTKTSVNHALQLNTSQIRSSGPFCFVGVFFPKEKNAWVLKQRMDFWLTEMTPSNY